MPPPGELYRVEWLAARSHDRPLDRAEKGRNFASLAQAAEQVRSIRGWPSHLELLGVWRTTSRRVNRFTLGDGRGASIQWERLDPAELPAVPAHVEARYAALEAARAGAPPEQIAELVAGDDREESE